MRISVIIAVIGSLLIVCKDAHSQDLKAGQELPDLSQEQKLNRLQYNFTAMILVHIAFAKENGYSTEDAGRWAGKQFAKSWGEELTPERFVRAMNRNWQILDIKPQILEVETNHIKAERGMIMPKDQFNKLHAYYGISLNDYQTFFAHILKAITSKYGLTYTESAKDSTITFMVSSDQK